MCGSTDSSRQNPTNRCNLISRALSARALNAGAFRAQPDAAAVSVVLRDGELATSSPRCPSRGIALRRTRFVNRGTGRNRRTKRAMLHGRRTRRHERACRCNSDSRCMASHQNRSSCNVHVKKIAASPRARAACDPFSCDAVLFGWWFLVAGCSINGDAQQVCCCGYSTPQRHLTALVSHRGHLDVDAGGAGGGDVHRHHVLRAIAAPRVDER